VHPIRRSKSNREGRQLRLQKQTRLLALLSLASIVFAAVLFSSDRPVTSQTLKKRAGSQNSNKPRSTPTPDTSAEVIKVDVDLVKVDALVMQKNTARIVGGLKKDDFLIYEDGTKQEITHFSQDSLPLSLLFVIDRAGCLDPYGDEMHRAAREAIERLKPIDEIAVMSYHDTTTLEQSFTRNRIMIETALNRIEPHNEAATHCLNTMFADAADYMMKASNPAGRRVIIVISAYTRFYDCPEGPSGKSAAQAIYESGSVVCGIVPKIRGQALESSLRTMATRLTRAFGADYMDMQTLANETGGEVLFEKPEKLDATFETLINHLRSRYNLAFVSTNRKRDGTTRNLRLDLTPASHKSQGKLVIRARRTYVAPRR
jgi:VWFA-related protein